MEDLSLISRIFEYFLEFFHLYTSFCTELKKKDKIKRNENPPKWYNITNKGGSLAKKGQKHCIPWI